MPKSQPKKASRLPKARPMDEQEETIHQTRYREDAEVDEYDEHKLQRLADDPCGSNGGDGPDA